MITRPRAAALRLADEIVAMGMTPIVAPMVEISALPVDAVFSRAYDLVIFVSTHAATIGIPALPDLVSTNAQIFAVGETTAAAIQEALGHNRRPHPQVPSGEFNSEGLLGLPALSSTAVSGKQSLIVRGQGGREHLADELRKRGAVVDYFEVYERLVTDERLATVLARHGVETPSIGLVTSVAGLSTLADKITIEKLARLFDMQILATGTRIARQVPTFGFTNPPLIADNPTSEGIVACLKRWIMEKL
ncbi:MAG: uroporphyrinogen-III synthase [Gammaproteobacteria bacterium]